MSPWLCQAEAEGPEVAVHPQPEGQWQMAPATLVHHPHAMESWADSGQPEAQPSSACICYGVQLGWPKAHSSSHSKTSGTHPPLWCWPQLTLSASS